LQSLQTAKGPELGQLIGLNMALQAG
jgi:hypothetical protein